MSERLNEIIDKLVEEKTFSGDAISRIADLQRAAADTSAERDTLNNTIERLEEKMSFTDDLLEKSRNDNSELVATIKAYEERVSREQELEKQAAVNKAVAETYGKCFELVFRNTEIHTETMRNIVEPPAVTGSNGGVHYPTVTTMPETTVTKKD